MKNTKFILLFSVLVCMMSFTPSLWGQGTVQEMFDKGKDLIIEGKNEEARKLLENVVTLDPKRKDEVQRYLDIINKPRPKPAPSNDFKLAQERLIFNGIPDDPQIVSVTCKKGDWNVESPEDWCKIVSVDKLFPEVTVTCEKNFSGQERKAVVFFINDSGNGNIIERRLQVRQKSEEEILKVRDGYIWRDPTKPSFLKLEAKGDLVIIDLDCNTEWRVVHKPDEVEVGNDNGDMSKLVIKVAGSNSFGGAVNLGSKLFGTIEKDYITIETVNQGKRLTIQTEKPKLGKTEEQKAEDSQIRAAKQAEREAMKEAKQAEKEAKQSVIEEKEPKSKKGKK